MNPEKTVLMPDGVADCPMAYDGCRAYPTITPNIEAAVVCYINSTAEAKAQRRLRNKRQCHAYRTSAAKSRNLLYRMKIWRGILRQSCRKNILYSIRATAMVHARLTAEMVKNAKEEHPKGAGAGASE